MGAYNKKYKQQCQRCGEYGHKHGNQRCPKNKNKKEENDKKTEYKNRKVDGISNHCCQKGNISRECWAWKNSHYKKFKKAKKAVDEDKDDLVLFLLMSESKTKENKKEKDRFAEDVKQSSEAGMVCTIDSNKFFLFTKNTWIGDSGELCHITNDKTGLYDIINIDESIQGSSSIMPAMKKGKL